VKTEAQILGIVGLGCGVIFAGLMLLALLHAAKEGRAEREAWEMEREEADAFVEVGVGERPGPIYKAYGCGPYDWQLRSLTVGEELAALEAMFAAPSREPSR
jgi:hypothetical protein